VTGTVEKAQRAEKGLGGPPFLRLGMLCSYPQLSFPRGFFCLEGILGETDDSGVIQALTARQKVEKSAVSHERFSATLESRSHLLDQRLEWRSLLKRSLMEKNGDLEVDLG